MKSCIAPRLLLTALTGFAVACSESPDPSAAPPSAPAAPAAGAADLTPVTGPRAARLVWLEQEAPDSPARRVFAFDAADGLGIRALSPESSDYSRPLLSSDGTAVVYTRLQARPDGDKTAYTPEVIFQPWNGPPRLLGPGMAVDFWRDPADGTDYLYAVASLLPGAAGRLTGETLLRFHPDKPDDREILWTATPLGTEQFQLSRDGRRAAGLFPFPKAALADLTNQTLTPLAPGGWAAGASDDSYAAAVLDGTRRRLRFFAPNLDPGWELTFMGAPGWQDGGLRSPRWSNDPSLLTFTGPHSGEETTADVCVVQLRADLRSIEKIVRLTEGRHALSPDLWVEAGPSPVSGLPQQPVVVPRPEPKPWPALTDELVFAWDHAGRRTPLPHAPATLTPRGFATWGRYFAMDPSSGWFEADDAAASSVAAACSRTQAWSMEMILTERPALPPLSVRLAALMLDDGREAFALYRVDRKLVLRLLLGGTPERPAQVHPVVLTNLAIESDRPVHVVISLRNNRLSCWLDGQMQKDFQLESSGLAAWGHGRLVFGDPQPYGTPWSGTIERVALWSRALGDDEIRQTAALAMQWVESRTRPARIKLKATLAAVPILTDPAPDALLGVTLWDVQQVFMGQLDARRIAVAGWSRLQGMAAPSTLPAVGQSMDLWLEPWDDHPELEAVPQAAPPGTAGLPRYFHPQPLRPLP